MKKIEAIIRTFKLDAVKEALNSIGIHDMTVTEIDETKTSDIGNGKIFVHSLEDVIKIGMGDKGKAAI